MSKLNLLPVKRFIVYSLVIFAALYAADYLEAELPQYLNAYKAALGGLLTTYLIYLYE